MTLLQEDLNNMGKEFESDDLNNMLHWKSVYRSLKMAPEIKCTTPIRNPNRDKEWIKTKI